MSLSSSLPDLRESYPPHAPHAVPEHKTSVPGLIPGIALLLFVVGYAGKFVEHAINTYTKLHKIAFPNIEYVMWAIIFGIVIANTVGLPKIFRPWCRDLRVLAQGRHHPARCALSARRHP